MDRMIYTAMNGAKHVMLKQASNNHNLANVSTTGFRRDLDAVASLTLYGPGYQSRVYADQRDAGIDQSPGSTQHTGRELDIALHGEGFIAVQADDGSEAYTRAGDLKVSTAGFLQTGSGHAVLGNGGPISIPPFEKIEVAADGTISIRPLGQTASTLAAVDRIRLVKPVESELVKRSDGLLEHKDQVAQPPDTSVKVVSGALESSNVNAVDALVNMIELSRQFELNIKLMERAESNDRASATVMRLS